MYRKCTRALNFENVPVLVASATHESIAASAELKVSYGARPGRAHTLTGGTAAPCPTICKVNRTAMRPTRAREGACEDGGAPPRLPRVMLQEARNTLFQIYCPHAVRNPVPAWPALCVVGVRGSDEHCCLDGLRDAGLVLFTPSFKIVATKGV